MTTYIFTNRANNTVEAFTASQLTGKLCYEHDDKDMAAVAQEVGLREQLWETIMQYTIQLPKFTVTQWNTKTASHTAWIYSMGKQSPPQTQERHPTTFITYGMHCVGRLLQLAATLYAARMRSVSVSMLTIWK